MGFCVAVELYGSSSKSVIQELRNVCAYSLRTCFVTANHWFLVWYIWFKGASASQVILVSGVHCDVETLPHAVVRLTLSRGTCRDSYGYYSVQPGPGAVGLFLFPKMK